jgi:hypothetical protein
MSTLDHVAVVGYSALFIFSMTKLRVTRKNPLDFVSNLFLLTGLGALILYHINMIRTELDVDKSTTQYSLRLVAHSAITSFFIITLIPYSKSVFRPYDWFGLAGHSYLFIAVLRNISQLFGIGMLAIYFTGATLRAGSKEGLELLQFAGRAFMTFFFVLSFVRGVLL